jgi:hypothetical protein
MATVIVSRDIHLIEVQLRTSAQHDWAHHVLRLGARTGYSLKERQGTRRSRVFQDLLDSLPIWGVSILFAVTALVLYELGFRLGRWWQGRSPEEKEGPTNMLVGSILALMAFLLAITMGMATDRFDARRGAVLAEANSIGTTYLRAGYLPELPSSQTQDLLREYVSLRVAPDVADLPAVLARSDEILTELWSIAEDLAKAAPDSEVLALYIDSLNETIDMNTVRVTAGLFARVPETITLLLFAGAVLTLAMVGFSAGLTRRRSPLTAIILILVLGAVFALIVDIDRPTGGTLKTSQQPIIALLEQIGPPGQ